MMCQVAGCPYRIVWSEGRWYHVDTHGADAGHEARGPRTSDPFDVTQHMPAGAKPSDPYEQTTTWHDDSPKPAYTPKATPWWRSNPTLGAAGATLALIGGIVVGASLPRETPAECEQAIGYAEEGLGQAASGLNSLGEAVDGGYLAKAKAVDDLDHVTKELNRLTPLYKDAKEKCLK